MLALSPHVSTYVCDILRSGVAAIPGGQWEAARALELRPATLFRPVILPQAWPFVLPPMANVAVSTSKLTAIPGILAVDDLDEGHRPDRRHGLPARRTLRRGRPDLSRRRPRPDRARHAPERRYGSGRLDRTCAARSPAL